jgi:hypothetical protein
LSLLLAPSSTGVLWGADIFRETAVESVVVEEVEVLLWSVPVEVVSSVVAGATVSAERPVVVDVGEVAVPASGIGRIPGQDRRLATGAARRYPDEKRYNLLLGRAGPSENQAGEAKTARGPEMKKELTFEILDGEIRSGAAEPIGSIGDIKVGIRPDAKGRWRVVIEGAPATLSPHQARRLADLILRATWRAGQYQRYERAPYEQKPPITHPDFQAHMNKFLDEVRTDKEEREAFEEFKRSRPRR